MKMNFAKVDGYPYVFHPCGTILRIWDGYTKEKKPRKEKGYMRIGLCKNGKQKFFSVHRLLALAFIPNPENKRCVDHINGIRDDNRLENLRWLTHKENLNAFRSNPAQIITKGSISKDTRKGRNSWKWQYRISGKGKTKTMKSKADLEKYREKKLAELL
tara:strand:- start:666 stop:1142 length:477 start_codon:yes stop_codon:yes gene_type:complete